MTTEEWWSLQSDPIDPTITPPMNPPMAAMASSPALAED
jgi:hypothetical protein